MHRCSWIRQTLFTLVLTTIFASTAGATGRVNVMPDRQVRPGTAVPVFGSADGGVGVNNGQPYGWTFTPNPNVQVVPDASGLSGTITSDRYIVETVTFNLLNGSTREVVTGTLTVGGVSNSVDIDIVALADGISDTPLDRLAIDVNIAIQNGLRAMYLAQQATGAWLHGVSNTVPYNCATTAFSVWAFVNSGHAPTNDPAADIYAEWVQKGVNVIASSAQTTAFSNQANIGNPDGDLDGRIISLCDGNVSPVGYANPIATAALIAAYRDAPDAVSPVAVAGLTGQTYRQIVQDSIDWIAFAQSEAAVPNRGGWRYTTNSGADTSVDSWSYVALEGFEAEFGGTVPELVKLEAERRIDGSQAETGSASIGGVIRSAVGQFGYTGTAPISGVASGGNATTAGGLSGLVMTTANGRTPALLNSTLASAVFPDVAARKTAAVAVLGAMWDVAGNIWTGNRGNFYAMWTTARALRLNGTTSLVNPANSAVAPTSAGGAAKTFNWETGEHVDAPGVVPGANHPREGFFNYLVRTQAASGAWAATVNTSSWTTNLNTAWGVLVLQPTVFGPPNRPPVALCADRTVEAGEGCVAPASIDNGSLDTDPDDNITIVQQPAGPFSLGVTNGVTLTVADRKGAEDSCTATVTVEDTIVPTVFVDTPAQPLECTGPLGAQFLVTAQAQDHCAINSTTCATAGGESLDDASPAWFAVGTTDVTCTAVDSSGNSGSTSASVVVVDTTAPTLECAAAIVLEATGPLGALFAGTTAFATDLCSETGPVSCTLADTTLALGSREVTCSTSDASGNTGTCTTSVTVRDTTPPVIVVPGDLVLEATSPAGAVATFGATATDIVNGAVPVTCTPVSGSTFALGTATVDCTATDAAGNSASDSFTVTVRDTAAPQLTLPGADIVVHATSPDGAVVTYDVFASDSIGGAVSITCVPPSGSTFALGATTVTCTAEDARGNRATGSFTVRVTNTAPECIATPTVSEIWPPDHRMVPIGVLGVTDPDGDEVTVTVTGVFQDEATNTFGDGNTSVDAEINGPVASVRAERSGNKRVPGDGRVYHIMFSGNDGRGGTCTGSLQVCVPHDQGRADTCQDGGPLFSSIPQ